MPWKHLKSHTFRNVVTQESNPIHYNVHDEYCEPCYKWGNQHEKHHKCYWGCIIYSSLHYITLEVSVLGWNNYVRWKIVCIWETSLEVGSNSYMPHPYILLLQYKIMIFDLIPTTTFKSWNLPFSQQNCC